MNIQDYLLPQDGYDWAKLLESLGDELPKSFTVWLVNRFGDLFLVYDDNSVNFFDTSACTFSKIAASRDEFCSLIDLDENASNWLMIPQVDAAVRSGMHLSPGQCYNFKVPPCLGGSWDLANISVTDLEVHLSFSADIYRQIKDLPDGTKINIKVVD